jgi:HSP20 family molecular chaperone IbpA
LFSWQQSGLVTGHFIAPEKSASLAIVGSSLRSLTADIEPNAHTGERGAEMKDRFFDADIKNREIENRVSLKLPGLRANGLHVHFVSLRFLSFKQNEIEAYFVTNDQIYSGRFRESVFYSAKFLDQPNGKNGCFLGD